MFEQTGETMMLCKHSVGALHSHPIGAKEINCFCTYYYRFLFILLAFVCSCAGDSENDWSNASLIDCGPACQF